MQFRLVERGWNKEIEAAGKQGQGIQIICPFIQKRTIARFLKNKPTPIKVITRFNLADFFQGVSDPEALKLLLEHDAQIRGVKNLHSKLYLFADSTAIVTSANLTEAALKRNHELGFVGNSPEIIRSCQKHFDGLWQRAGDDLTLSVLEGWQSKLHNAKQNQTPAPGLEGLTDEGVNAGIQGDNIHDIVVELPDAPQVFIKFYGKSDNRVHVSLLISDEIRISGSDKTCNYPQEKRPRNVRDGDIMYLGRMMESPNDVRIYGRGIAKKYEDDKDDATPEELAKDDWRKHWCHYIRLSNTEFLAGDLGNGISLNELMDNLAENAFASTQENAAKEDGNISPHASLGRKSNVRLSATSARWLDDRFDAALKRFGRLQAEDYQQTSASIEKPAYKELSADALSLFKILVDRIKSPAFKVSQYETYITYTQVLEAMEIEPSGDIGIQFEQRGAAALNTWLRNYKPRLPALTGLVISENERRRYPGANYFKTNGHTPLDHDWWTTEIVAASNENWNDYV